MHFKSPRFIINIFSLTTRSRTPIISRYQPIQKRTMSSQISNSHVTAVSLFTLSGFNAVVTGGGSGIGLMATQALAANGATLYIIGRRLDALKTVAEKYSPSISGGKIIPKAGDITDKASLQKLAEEIGSEVGEKGIQVLCNNAGVAEEQETTSFSQKDGQKVDFADAEQLGKWLWRSEQEGWEKTLGRTLPHR